MGGGTVKTTPGEHALVVIGANYGDEGKGLITDFLTGELNKAVVIRHNASAQAAHTVRTPDGRHHVFHQVGSGTFVGASTMLSQFFVAHPMLLAEELAALENLGVTPTLYVDPRATVAVPYDVLINQLAEATRGALRHGSCGIGFNEAVERNLRPSFALTVQDFAEPDWVFERLRAIRDSWVPHRLRALGLTVPEEQRTLFTGDALLWRWMEDMSAFRTRTVIVTPGVLPPGRPIFEGAQGLLLDEDGDDFPHVTRSKTGLTNVIRTAQETEITQLDVTYVTRAYLTRHGAGPLANEVDKPEGVSDPTNQPNAFQGSLRFAWLDLDTLAERLERDLAFRATGITARAGIAVTCLDQMPEVTYITGGEPRTASRAQFLNDIEAATGLPVTLTSNGPARSDVTRREAHEVPPASPYVAERSTASSFIGSAARSGIADRRRRHRLPNIGW